MPVTAMFMRLSRACFAIGSLQVFPHPRQAVFGFSRGCVFRADPALVAEPVDEIEQGRETDLARSGLVPAGNVGDLHVPDLREIRRKGRGEIVSHDMHVEEVVLQFEIGGAHVVNERERLGGSAEEKTWNRVRTDRLDVWPLNNAPMAVVNLMNPAHVDTVFIAGKVKKWRGNSVGVDVARVLRLVEESRDAVVRRTGFQMNMLG